MIHVSAAAVGLRHPETWHGESVDFNRTACGFAVADQQVLDTLDLMLPAIARGVPTCPACAVAWDRWLESRPVPGEAR